MSLELTFKVRTDGERQLAGIGQAIDSLAARTKLSSTELQSWETVVKSSIETGYSLSKSIDIANKTFGSGGVAIKAFTTEIKGHIAEMNRAASTIGTHTIPQMAAASAAIRGLEGSMSIRAAERFLSTFQGIGPVLQAAFPVFGALAFVEIIGRMTEKVGELYNAWNPVVHAQKESLEILKQSIPELEKLTRETARLTEQSRRREFGTAYALRLESDTSSHDAASDQRTIDRLRAQIATERAKIDSGTVAGRSTAQGSLSGRGYVKIDAQAAQEKLIGLEAKLENAIQLQKVDQLKSEDAKAELAKDSLQKERERQNKIETIGRATEQIRERSLALADKAELAPLGPIGTLMAQRRATERRYARELSDVDDQIRLNRLGGPDTVRVPQSVYGSQRAAILEARKRDLESIAQESVAATFKQAEEYGIASERFRLYDQTTQSPGISQFQKVLSGRRRLGLTDTSRELQADDEIRRVARGGQREGIQLDFQRAQNIASNSTFNPFDAVTLAYRNRLALADKLKAVELSSANDARTAEEKRVEIARALVERKLEGIRAETDAEQKLLEMEHQREQSYRQFAAGIFGAITSHDPTTALRSFGIGQGRELGSKIFTNLASLTYPTFKAGGLDSLIPGQRDGNGNLTTIGKIFSNTPLGGKDTALITNSNKLETVNTTLSTLDQDLNRLTQVITDPQAAGAPSISTGSSGFQIPGIVGSALLGGGAAASGYAGLFGAQKGADSTTTLNYPGMPKFDDNTARASLSASVANGVKSALTISGGIYGAYAGVRQAVQGFGGGTAQGAFQGLAGAATTVASGAAGIAGIAKLAGSAIPGLGAVVSIASAAAAALGLGSTLFGDPKQNFANQQQRDLRAHTYFGPQAIRAISDTSGRLVDYGADGLPRGGSPYGAFDFDQHLGYFSHKNNVYTQVPGYVTPGYSAPPAPQAPPNPPPPAINITQHITAWDTKSFMDNSGQIADAIKFRIQQGHPVRKEIANVANLRS